MNKKPTSVVIIGGGWAGLATAITLCRSGYSVELFESAKQGGGRARCAPFSGDKVDNGQHLMIGAYHYMQQIMREIGLDTEKCFSRHPVSLEILDNSGKRARLKVANLPAPLHLLGAIFKSRGFSISELGAITRFLFRHQRSGFMLDSDISVSDMLDDQPESLCNKLWYPLCIATLNTPPSIASGRIFLRVLHDSFMQDPVHSDLLIPTVDLGTLFPEPAIDYIEAHQGQVHIGMRVSGLDIRNNKVTGIVADDRHYHAEHVVIATSHHQAISLTGSHDRLNNITSKLQSIKTQPICTVYLKYPAESALEFPMIGLTNNTSQWIFDRRICNQPGMMAVVISADGPHMQLDKKTLAQLVIDELASCYPHWPEPIDSMVIREKRATFSAEVGIDDLRPAQKTPVQDLWLAGDYTATGYPATLEGAVRSGVQCAESIMKQQEEQHV